MLLKNMMMKKYSENNILTKIIIKKEKERIEIKIE
jgi:hypothetical protein